MAGGAGRPSDLGARVTDWAGEMGHRDQRKAPPKRGWDGLFETLVATNVQTKGTNNDDECANNKHKFN